MITTPISALGIHPPVSQTYYSKTICTQVIVLKLIKSSARPEGGRSSRTLFYVNTHCLWITFDYFFAIIHADNWGKNIRKVNCCTIIFHNLLHCRSSRAIAADDKGIVTSQYPKSRECPARVRFGFFAVDHLRPVRRP